MSRKGGTEGGWQVHPQGANSMAASGLSCRKALVGAGWPISGKNGLRNKLFHLVGPLFPTFRVHLSASPGWHSPEAWIVILLSGRRG